ncbi:MAG: hypothetical protein KatS3mg014_2579 [Actinomycetota bacterium]|nr:MAG: hypothetical protein KatS3mg014_2579 [Actinomycetota bacterium]
MATPLFSVGGLVSGLDTNAIVSQLMQLERTPIVRLRSRQAAYRAKIDAWGTVRTRLSAIATAADRLKDAAGLRAFGAAASSDPGVVQVTATGEVEPGSLSFTVERLAARHQVASAASFPGSEAVVGAGTLTITRGTASFQVTTTPTTTLAELARQIDALGAGVRATVVSVDGTSSRLLLAAEATGADAAFSVSGTQAGLTAFDVVEQGVDAQLRVGSGAGALTVTRASNTIDDLIPGVRLTLKATSAAPVTVTAERDADGVVSAVKGLVDGLNQAISTLKDLTRYDPASKKAGALQGDPEAWRLLMDLQTAVSEAIVGPGGTRTSASAIGITLNRDGTFSLNEAALRDALRSDFDAVVGLLARTGTASDPRLSFSYATDATRAGTYAVVLTRAAEVPAVTGVPYAPPAADETFGITVGSLTATVTVGAGSTLGQAIEAINAALRAAGITTVVASDTGSGSIRLAGTRYGSKATFTVADDDAFGLNGTFVGVDAAGTIDGQAASGAGRVLTASTGNAAGLQVRVTAGAEEVAAAGGSLDLGSIVYTEGAVGRLSRVLAAARSVGGLVDLATDRWRSQVSLIDDQIGAIERRLELREAELRRRFSAMETTLSGLTAQANWLAAQLPGLAGGGS